MEKITIEFIEHHPPYMKGDVATFFKREADRLTDRGYAVYRGGDAKRESAADRLKEIRGVGTKSVPGPAETRHIPAAPDTRHIPGAPDIKAPSVEGGGNQGPKCGNCRKPGHDRRSCPDK